jgi:hypothetical protein
MKWTTPSKNKKIKLDKFGDERLDERSFCKDSRGVGLLI